MKDHIKLLRPHQWIKNLFVLIPAFFAARFSLLLTDGALWYALFSFCFAASAVYIINDIFDRDNDRLHEVKRLRPIASGAVSVRSALMVCAVMFVLAAVLALLVNTTFVVVVGIYFWSNLLYSFYLKHISIVDISIIAVGFVLRVIGGGVAADVPVSKWLILMTFLLASCLALGKRRDDLMLNVENNGLRRSLDGYTIGFVDTSLVVLSVTTIVCYIMYTVSDEVVLRMHSEYIYLTAIFVIIGILRYLQIAIVEQASGSPTLILLKDRLIQAMILMWLSSFAVFLYVL
ncbi:MAG: UbiA prenyltransferase family protein [Blastocatellia bacterium]|nr:UbiA prenyltransferase family protein [Blastocatellia bacterium]